MSIVVFSGPTIASADVVKELDADVRPPAQRGDVLRAALDAPDAIVLIDGYFDRVPSVWHKEILWAMSRGIHVFGASSMGALRAAELAAFGMVGIGEIFEAFQQGELEDDDEVAVVHAEADSKYRPASEALVNIRWTLRAAERHGILSTSTRIELEQRAKELPYDQRALAMVLRGARDLAEREIAQLRDWLPLGRVDQKRADALSALRQVAELDRSGWQKKVVDYEFAETDGWQTLFAQIEASRGRRGLAAIDASLEHELRARGWLGQTLAEATLRVLAEERLRERGVQLNARAVEGWIDEFRRERELLSEESFDAWLKEQDLQEEDLVAYFQREAVAAATRAEWRGQLAEAVEDTLRASGRLGEIAAAVKQQQALLDPLGLAAPTLEQAGVSESELWAWFFGERLQRAVPASVVAYAASEGSTIDELRTAALRAWLSARLLDGAPSH